MKTYFLQSLLYILTVLCLLKCTSHYTASSVQGEYVELDSTFFNENQKLENLIAPYNDGLEKKMNRVLIYSAQSMTKARPEGLLSNLVADLIFEEVNELPNTHADFCLLNHGGLRSSLPQGNITVQNIYELMPFDNEAVILELSAKKVLSIASYLKESKGEPIANAQVNLSETPEISINYAPVDTSRTYRVITSDYLANGGDKMFFFSDPISYEVTGFKIRDLIIEYMEEEQAANKQLNSQLDGRIK